jgi:hypothetical protein
MSDICLKETGGLIGNHVLPPFALEEKGLGDEVKETGGVNGKRVMLRQAQHDRFYGFCFSFLFVRLAAISLRALAHFAVSKEKTGGFNEW